MSTKPLLISAVILAAVATAPAQTLLAGWDFKTAPGAILDPKTETARVPTLLAANMGTGILRLDGSFGSSAWTGEAGETTQLRAMGGTPLNAEGLPSLPKGSASLGLRQPADALKNGVDTNGKSLVIEVPGSPALAVNYAVRRSSPNTFQQILWEVSADAKTWTTFDTISYAAGPTGDWVVTELKPAPAQPGAEKTYLRATFSGATPNPSGARNFQLGNIRVLTAEKP